MACQSINILNTLFLLGQPKLNFGNIDTNYSDMEIVYSRDGVAS